MQIPAERLIHGLRRKLDVMLGSTDSFGSDEEAVRSALTLLHNRQRSGQEILPLWLISLAEEADAVSEMLDLRICASDIADRLSSLASQARAAAGLNGLETIEAASRTLLHGFAEITAGIVGDSRLDEKQRGAVAARIGQWDAARITAAAGGRELDTAGAAHPITQATLTHYLADRFSDPDMTVTEFRHLPGGFGKQTYLFAAKGKDLTGEFVLRRDHGGFPVDNDCHRIRNEYPVIRAAHGHDFPAPEALWLDIDHALLPGGDFIVMRRAPGSPGGSVFSAEGGISDELMTVLATTLARLHSLPPLEELGDITESLNADFWHLSLREAARRYISGYRDLYIEKAAEITPAILGLYAWVLQSLPDPEGRPVLVHGDVGFHNMVLESGKLSALVDWEFAHVGDPAEDLAYVRNTAGTSLDWDRFIDLYRAAGGPSIDPARIHVFQVWGQLRNATASTLTISSFIKGDLDELKFAHTGFYHSPMFVKAAADLIEAGPSPG